MSLEHTIEAINLLVIMVLLVVLVWYRPPKRLSGVEEEGNKDSGAWRRWKAKTPKDCPACESGVKLAIRPMRREVNPWCERKSKRGRKKTIQTQSHACLNLRCEYYGIRDERVHALVGNGKRGQRSDIQTLKCQRYKSSFSTRRNTPLYYLKTHPEQIEMCLWLLAEGVDISVLVRFTGHVDGTVARWLRRAGEHSKVLHDLLFVAMDVGYVQVDELYAPVAGNKRKSWLWVAIEPVSKIIPAIHLGARKTEDAYQFVHELKMHLREDCVPAITSDGLRGYFYAITAHFGAWAGKTWVVSSLLAYGQMVKRRNKRLGDGESYIITRMKCGKRWQVFVRVAMLLYQLLAYCFGREPRIQPLTLKGRVGLILPIHNAADIILQLWQPFLCPVTTTCCEVVLDCSVFQIPLPFANNIPAPA